MGQAITTGIGAVNTFQLHKLGRAVANVSGQVTSLQTATSTISSQVNSLQAATQGLVSLAQGTLVISGLTLAVSVASFIVLSHKLGKIDERLKEVAKDVKDIKSFLQSSERGRLQNALKTLNGATLKDPNNAAIAMLVDARKTLGEIHERYREMFETVEDYATASAVEEYFAVTALAVARCTAELGSFEFAEKEFASAVLTWRSAGKRIARRFLDGPERNRLLTVKYADAIDTGTLGEWFDFVYANDDSDAKGIGWIDTLRKEFHPDKAYLGQGALNTGVNFVLRFSGGDRYFRVGLESEEKTVVELIQRMASRDRIFEGYKLQYQCFAEHQQRPSALENGFLGRMCG